MLQSILLSVGIITMIACSARAVSILRLYTRKSDLTKYRRHNAWALVTGSSDGLGYAMADELLDRGFNVVLHGRSEARLATKRDALLEKHPSREVAVISADASPANPADIERMASFCKRLPGPLTILVNNVGGQVTTPRHWRLDESPSQDAIKDTVNANTLFPTLLTSALLPLLKENRPSLIINSGSMGALVPTPYLVVYSGTKAYLHAVSASLAAETHLQSVDVLGAVFGAVLTPGNPHGAQEFMVTPAQAARGCLDKVGCGETVVLVHWKFWVQSLFLVLLPTSLTLAMGMKIMDKRVAEEREMMEKRE